MKRRVINILNNKGQRRTFKFLSDNESGIIIYSTDKPNITQKESIGDVIIDLLKYDDGPVIQIGNNITFNKHGKYKVVSIYQTDYEDKPNCFYLDTLKLDHYE